jgi:hypothetical protein
MGYHADVEEAILGSRRLLKETRSRLAACSAWQSDMNQKISATLKAITQSQRLIASTDKALEAFGPLRHTSPSGK